MEYLVFALAATFAFSVNAFARRKGNEKWNAVSDRLAIIPLAIFFALRFFAVDRKILLHNLNAFSYVDGVTVMSVFGITKFAAVMTFIACWISVTAFLIVAIRPFFALKSLDILTKFFVPVSSILGIILIKNVYSVTASAYFETSLFSVAFAGEVGYALGIALALHLRDITSGYYKEHKFDIRAAAIALGCLALMLAATMPTYFIQITYGYTKKTLRVVDLSPTHRQFLYATFIAPFILYFSLRGKSDEVKRASMVYLSLATMITYSLMYSYKDFTDLSSWPFHLCNTAMYVVPVCLVFRFKKLFYFTYFINVLGALFAMLMPNYDKAANALSWSMLNFWVNHACAFFYPLLCVALGLFPRPDKKYYFWSMFFFFLYYLLVLFLNTYFTAHGKETDFFFINSNFIADKFPGTWANKLFNITAGFRVGGYEYVFHPVYQILYFVVYILLGIAVWFVYGLFFNVAASHADIARRRKKIRLDKYALLSRLDGRGIDEPMDMNAGIKLELKSFSKRYDVSKDYAVKDASLTVYGGEIFGFLGPNGAGKSTIIKSIVGIQPITEGAIEVCGYDCAKQPIMAKRQIGYVPDHYALYERLTGREYINYIADIYEVPQDKRTERLEKYVSLFELENAIDAPIRTYSHGMKQKITIMSALIHDPKIWILDEPLTGLDPNSIFQVKECMREHARKGNIVFFSSHIIEVVEKLCDRITIIKKGRIQCTRSITDIEKECSLEEFYLKTIGADELIDREKQLGLIKPKA